ETAIEAGASVAGDVVVIGGSLRMDGRIANSAIVIGGNASLGESSAIGTDLIALGGAFRRESGAIIGGDIITNLPITSRVLPRASISPAHGFPATTAIKFDFGPLGVLASVLFPAIGFGAIAMLLTAFLHPQLDRVAQAAGRQPFAAGSLGLLTVILAPLAIAILAITLILIPLALAAAILLALAWLFGVVALGHLVGDRLLQAMHRTWEPVLSAGFGALMLGLVMGASNQIPCVGWMTAVLVGLVGLGAASMTLFGTRPWPNASSAHVAALTNADRDVLPPAS
ncbi:MAG TPA: hypothetical protein VFH29_08175, partial [Anaerolineales bacterium]|nr:hypothetical protein [Anaerolineales bacterium]